jgi:hypothetical protein
VGNESCYPMKSTLIIITVLSNRSRKVIIIGTSEDWMKEEAGTSFVVSVAPRDFLWSSCKSSCGHSRSDLLQHLICERNPILLSVRIMIIAVKGHKPRMKRGTAVLDKHMSPTLKQGCQETSPRLCRKHSILLSEFVLDWAFFSGGWKK